MELKAAWGLGKLKQKVRQDLEKVLAERRKLGVTVPDDFEVRLRYAGDSNESASAHLEIDNPVVTINVLQTTADRFKGADLDAVCKLSWYFDIGRHILPDDDTVIHTMRHPVKAIDGYEHDLGRKEINSVKEGLELDGIKYSSDKSKLIKNARQTRKIFEQIRPKLKQRFEQMKLSQSSLRHEIDHVAFFSSRFSKNYMNVSACEQSMRELSDSYAVRNVTAIQDGTLKMASEYDVLAESRGLFFNYVPFNHWDLVDYEKIKKKVYALFQHNYIESKLQSGVILPAMIVKYFGRKKFTEDTINYLRTLVYSQSGELAKAEGIEVKVAGVDMALVNEIFYDEMPKWKKLYARNAESAIDAIGDAFNEDPTRFKIADRNAMTFSHYLKILKGSK